MNSRVLFCVLFVVFASVVEADLVPVNLCNAYPSAGYVTWTWGSVTTGKIDYATCTVANFDTNFTTGTISLYGANGLPTQTAVSAPTTLCSVGDRNILAAYSNSSTLAGLSISLASGCDKLAQNNIVLAVVDVDCALSTSVDLWFISTTNNVQSPTKMNNYGALTCGTYATVELPEYGTAISSATTTKLAVFAAGTQNSVSVDGNQVGPFDVSTSGAPAVPGTLVFFVSGDANNNAQAFWTATSPAGKFASGAHMQHDNAVYALITALAMIALSMLHKF